MRLLGRSVVDVARQSGGLDSTQEHEEIVQRLLGRRHGDRQGYATRYRSLISPGSRHMAHAGQCRISRVQLNQNWTLSARATTDDCRVKAQDLFYLFSIARSGWLP